MSLLLNQALSSLNFFKVPIRLKINRCDFYSSRIGEVISLGIIGVLLFMLVTNDVFYKINPDTMEKALTTQFHPRYNLTIDNFFLAVELAEMGGIGLPYNPKIFSFKITYIASSLSKNLSGFEIEKYVVKEMIPCNQSAYTKLDKYRSILSLHPYGLCMPNTDFDVDGAYTQKRISKISISLEMCKNTTANNSTCKPQKDISTYLTGKFLGYVAFDKQIDLGDYEQPIKIKVPGIFKSLEPAIRKKTLLMMDKMTVNSDVGFLWKEEKKIEDWKFGETIEDFDFLNQIALYELHLFSSDVERTYIRRYKKIQDALASLGGILNFFVVVGFFVLKMVPFTGMDYILSNHLFSFRRWRDKIEGKSNNDNMNTPDSLRKMNSLELADLKISNQKNNPNRNSFDIPQNSSYRYKADHLEKQQNPEKIKIPPLAGDEEKNDCFMESEKIIENFRRKTEFDLTLAKKRTSFKPSKTKGDAGLGEKIAVYIKKKNKKKNLHFSLKDFFGKKNRQALKEKLQLLGAAGQNVKDQLDIMHILEKLQEIDKLKLLLLNPEQLLLFKLISKPEILLEELIEHEKHENHPGSYMAKSFKKIEETSDKNIRDLVVYYNKIKEKNEKSENLDTDARLLKLLDDDMKKYLSI